MADGGRRQGVGGRPEAGGPAGPFSPRDLLAGVLSELTFMLLCGGLDSQLRALADPTAGRPRSTWCAAPVDLGELVFGAGEADLEAFDFAEPAFAFGFGDAGDQVVADLGEAGPLGGIRPVHAGIARRCARGCRGCRRRGRRCRWRPCGVRSGRGTRPIPRRWGRGIPRWAAGRGGGPGTPGGPGWPRRGRRPCSRCVTLMSRCPAMTWAMCGGRPFRIGVGDEEPAEVVRGVVQRPAGGGVGQPGVRRARR